MKRQYVVTAAIASAAILIGGIIGVLTSNTTPNNVSAASKPEPDPGVIYDAPDWVREHRGPIGLHTVGEPGEVYGVATTTAEKWIELEPGYAASVDLTEKTRDDPIYAVFIRGKWGVVGPPMLLTDEEGNPSVEEPEIRYNLTACRAVLDKQGLELNAQCWVKEKPAVPAFGEAFNDQ